LKFLLEKAGKVLSKKNRTAVEDAVAALNKVLEADKPKESNEDLKSMIKSAMEAKEVLMKVNIPEIKIEKKEDKLPEIKIAKKKGISKKKINKAIRELIKVKKKS